NGLYISDSICRSTATGTAGGAGFRIGNAVAPVIRARLQGCEGQSNGTPSIGWAGIYLDSCVEPAVIDCFIPSGGRDGIYLQNCLRPIIKGNRVRDVQRTGIEVFWNNAEAIDSTGAVGADISDNTVSNFGLVGGARRGIIARISSLSG